MYSKQDAGGMFPEAFEALLSKIDWTQLSHDYAIVNVKYNYTPAGWLYMV